MRHHQSQTCTVGCGREVPDTCYVCPECGATLRDLLAAVPDRVGERAVVVIDAHRRGGQVRTSGDRPVVPGLASDLDDAAARSATVTAHLPADPVNDLPAEDGPVHMPYATRPTEARWALRNTLVRWGDDIAKRRGLFRPFDTLPALATWMGDQVQWLRQQPDGGQAIDEMTAALRAAIVAVLGPAERRYVGPCTEIRIGADGVRSVCGTELYAAAWMTRITCPACGAVFGIEERREWLLDQAADMLLPRAELARALAGFGVVVTTKQLDHWTTRGRLSAKGATRSRPPRPTYRVGDVLDLVRTIPARSRHQG